MWAMSTEVRSVQAERQLSAYPQCPVPPLHPTSSTDYGYIHRNVSIFHMQELRHSMNNFSLFSSCKAPRYSTLVSWRCQCLLCLSVFISPTLLLLCELRSLTSFPSTLKILLVYVPPTWLSHLKVSCCWPRLWSPVSFDLQAHFQTLKSVGERQELKRSIT